jgi:anti-anti-sigma factor
MITKPELAAAIAAGRVADRTAHICITPSHRSGARMHGDGPTAPDPGVGGLGQVGRLFQFYREQADVMIFFHQVRGGPAGVRLMLSGEIDLSVREELRSVLAGVVAASPDATDVDLHDVTFLDCCGIGEFIRAYLDAHGRGHTLTVSRPRGIVRRALELTDVLAVLTLDPAAVATRSQ